MHKQGLEGGPVLRRVNFSQYPELSGQPKPNTLHMKYNENLFVLSFFMQSDFLTPSQRRQVQSRISALETTMTELHVWCRSFLSDK